MKPFVELLDNDINEWMAVNVGGWDGCITHRAGSVAAQAKGIQ